MYIWVMQTAASALPARFPCRGCAHEGTKKERGNITCVCALPAGSGSAGISRSARAGERLVNRKPAYIRIYIYT